MKKLIAILKNLIDMNKDGKLDLQDLWELLELLKRLDK